MRKSFIRLLGIVAILTWSAQAFAAGLGGIKIISALGQPLDVEIELVAFTKQERISAQARLASPEAYQGVGLDYPGDLKFVFRVRTRNDGSSYIKVTTTQAVNDPFVNLLVDLVWTPGRLLREYTFLLDPPGYKVGPEEGEVMAVAPEAQGASDGTRTDGAARSKGAYKGGTVTVKRGDTLNRISARNKPVEVSLERMLVALYRNNIAQFDGNNMNRIKVGKVLHLPTRAQLSKVKQAEAVKEIRAQAEDWNAYRQKLASSVAPARKAAPVKQATQGKITTSVSDKAPAPEESAEGVLKLSRGESPGDGVGAGAVGKDKGAQEAGDVQQEQAITSAKSASEAQRRTEVLEKNIEDAKRLAELKAAGAAAVSAPEAAQPVSLIDRILSEPSYLIGLIAAVLGLGGLALLLLRSSGEENSERKASDVWIAPDSNASLVTPAKPEEQPAKPEKMVEAVPDEGQIDPINEAGLLLNFGRDAQAEEVLKEAMQKQPGNHQIYLKLLDMYASRKNTASFAEIAQQLRDSGDEDAWQQAVEMGRKLEPDNPLYGSNVEEEPAVVEEQAEAEPEEVPPPVEEVLEFRLDDEKPAEPASEEATAEETEPRFQAAGDMLSDISLNLDETNAPESAAPENADEHWQEVATKLDLARAYHEMGDTDGARAILEEVMREGDDSQRETAQSLLDRIG